MTPRRLAHLLVVQLHIALVLIIARKASAAARDDSSSPNEPGEAKRRELHKNSHFNLRMFWQKGYRWQENSSEKVWCMKCKSSRCSRKSGLMIEKCDRGDWRQHFYFDDGRIRTRRNKDACLEREGRSIVLENCDGSRNQVWASLRKDEPFQLRIPGNTKKCVSQHHHPRKEEKLYMTSCKRSVASESDKWIVY